MSSFFCLIKIKFQYQPPYIEIMDLDILKLVCLKGSLAYAY